MVSETAVVVTKEKLSEGIYSMWLETRAAIGARPGQFVMLNTKSEAHLLGRPVSICEFDEVNGRIRLVWRVAGYGTDELSRVKLGDKLDLTGSLGNGYDIKSAMSTYRVAVMGGGIGIPPLLGLVKALKTEGVENIDIYLGYRSSSTGLFLSDEFKQYGSVNITTDDGSFGSAGTVLDALKSGNAKPELIYACGPVPMLKGIKVYSEERLIPAYISLEERMACGVGACLGCVVKLKFKDEHSKVENARICTEGPVFAAKDVDI